MKRILLAGGTGYLGKHIALALQQRDITFRVIARNPEKLNSLGISPEQIFTAELTDAASISGCCENIDIVISTLGITKQKDGLTYMDVDYQGNLNLLKEAKNSGVTKFIYVSALNAEKLRHLKICHAKELFVDELKASGINYCVIRPNGFFSDMTEFMNMARSGRVYLFGNGQYRMNPIHGADLAQFCIDAMEHPYTELEVGGPETFTQNEIAELAFSVLGKLRKTSHIPDWVRRTTLRLIRLFTNSKSYGPIEFFMTVMATDMLAKEYGKHTLKKYFESIKNHKSEEVANHED